MTREARLMSGIVREFAGSRPKLSVQGRLRMMHLSAAAFRAIPANFQPCHQDAEPTLLFQFAL
jgi:hypothetical protein